jgi:hypothetical protein
MKRIKWVGISLPLIVLLVASLACDVPGSSDTDENLEATATMKALATEVAGTLDPAGEDGEDSSEADAQDAQDAQEDNAAEPSVTPTVTVTPTLGPPMVSVSVDTNCRFGPGEVYEYQGALLVGEQATITGKLADESFWHIENPDAPPPFCWIWAAYAQVVGDTSGVPILTPPPTPTATPEPMNFTASEYAVIQCIDYAFVTKIANTGAVPIESYTITIVHPNEGVTLINTQDFFAGDPVCGFVHVDSVPVGGIEFIVLEGFQVPAGLYKVTVKVCTEDGLGGTCKETYFEVTSI